MFIMKSTDPLNIKELLSHDSLHEAEKLAGKSYKEDLDVARLGMVLGMQKNEETKAMMYLTKDTHFSQTLAEFKEVLVDMGFKEVYVCDIPEGSYSKGDKFYIYWNPEGLLICFDSYNGNTSVNGGSCYFNYAGDRDAMFQCSNGFAGEVDGVNVYSGHKDVREGLRFTLNQMKENGKILDKWIERPFLWLLHYMDTKVEGYDYKKISEERIAQLPKEVQEAITPLTK